MARKSIVEQIQANDPSFDPLAPALAAAKVSREQFAAAFDRVVVDGFSGPISPAAWREGDGREPATVDEALKVLARVSDQIDDYSEEYTAYCPFDGDSCTEDPEFCSGHVRFDLLASAEQIRRDVFAQVVEIYGHLPF